MRAALFRLLCVAVIALSGASVARAEVLDFAALNGWREDHHSEALAAFRTTCAQLEAPEWRALCAIAADVGTDDPSARAFFELFFRPVLIGTPPALFTGYYEPELRGALRPGGRFLWPIYARPPELQEGQVYHSRSVIEGGALRGRGLELAWLDDPVEAFFLHIQGSGRVVLPDGRVMRVGYAGRNGHAYRSVGQELVRRGIFSAHEVSAQTIKAYVRQHQGQAEALLNHNPSYIFFRKINDLSPELGPIGAMGKPIVGLRSVAVDPAFVPLGAPVWVEKAGRAPLNRLMVGPGTGGAIKGRQRADIFYGTGPAAGEAAGRVRDGGRMLVLLPIERALAMAEGL